MNVRIYKPEDNPVLACLVSETIQAINSADYSPEQVEVWASEPPDLERYLSRIAGSTVFVAEDNSEIVGFTTLEPSGHLDYLYVHRRFQRRGIASALLRRIEEEGVSRGINRIFTESSISARPLFERIGFRVIAPENRVFRGTTFLVHRMEKFLV
jgi:putative acetyltransferase